MNFLVSLLTAASAAPMGKDENTPDWVQHIAFKVNDRAELIEFKEHLEKNGVEVLGVTDHSIFHSIYFFDPNGHRLELCANVDRPGALEKLHEVAPAMIEEWSRTKKAPRHAAFMHNKEFSLDP